MNGKCMENALITLTIPLLVRFRPGTTKTVQEFVDEVFDVLKAYPEIACNQNSNSTRKQLWEIRLCYDRPKLEKLPNKLLNCTHQLPVRSGRRIGPCGKMTDRIIFPLVCLTIHVMGLRHNIDPLNNGIDNFIRIFPCVTIWLISKYLLLAVAVVCLSTCFRLYSQLSSLNISTLIHHQVKGLASPPTIISNGRLLHDMERYFDTSNPFRIHKTTAFLFSFFTTFSLTNNLFVPYKFYFILIAKKLASQYQKEADKRNPGMETCEEVRKKAEEALLAQMKLTTMWEMRARQKGWREKVTKSNAQTQAANKQHAVDTICALNRNSGVSFRYFMCKKIIDRTCSRIN
ncbi:hypothetical protein CXB51_026270 [Gossypium anomalum]|uniref:Uncharacterized protein n=1 Tax=Gossypium anomalum TaxID=47600 RepID=A0A8J5YDR7_9ROSI|nr:hypothetical protein CXB51_026270 [Gossypium anomalum]